MIAGIVSILVVVSLVAVVLWPYTVPPPSSSPSYPVVAASLGGLNGSSVALGSGFLGVNVRADSPLPASSAAVLNSTSARLVRWPGGAIADRLDPLATSGQGLIYNDSGTTETPATTLAQFVQWCEAVSCQSIITLPAEIDNASEALAIVNYTEKGLGFHPTFWEIGNEPALWEHFGIQWNRWNTSQASTPSPAQYANEVAVYAAAVHSVDPTTGIIGLGGVGKGASNQAGWISSVVTSAGPDLAAIAIHVYPAGSGYPVSDLPAWFGSLWGATSLASRVESAVDSVQLACASCRISVLVDEFQAGTGLTTTTALSGGYLASYVATELIQALPLPVRSLDYYDFQGGTPGAWLNPQGTPSASLDLYQALAGRLGAVTVQLNVSSSAQGIAAALGGTTAAQLENLMVVNTNTTYGVRLNLSEQFPDAASGVQWLFEGPSSSPTTGTLTAATAQNFTVPPGSVAILSDLGTMSPLSGGNRTIAPLFRARATTDSQIPHASPEASLFPSLGTERWVVPLAFATVGTIASSPARPRW